MKERLRGEPTRNYLFLDLGPYASLVTDVRVGRWGTEVVVSCVYDPLGARKPYEVILSGCRRVEWSLIDAELVHELEADIIGFELVAEARDHAVMSTDIFELAVWYDKYEVIRDW